MKILVTGGAGYIGSHFLHLLAPLGHDVIVVDNLSNGRPEAILYGRHENIDLRDKKEVASLFERENFDACVHFAASISVEESVSNPSLYYENNFIVSLTLAELCRLHGVNKFIFSSTAMVYGTDQPDGFFSEKDSTRPVSPYGNSKLFSEMAINDICQVSDLNAVHLRYFNVGGANTELKTGQSSKTSTHLIKMACECVTGKRKELVVFGNDYETKDGTCVRDYVHVDDLAQAHLDALLFLEKEKKTETFNCGYGHGYSVLEVIQAVKKVSGVDFPVSVGKRRAGDAPKLVSNSEKIRKLLGWTPVNNDLDVIVKTALDWERKLNESDDGK